ncbi:MAG TPA: hypothetical protein VFZ02_14290, partial [Ktedonobacteraceae bacterium]
FEDAWAYYLTDQMLSSGCGHIKAPPGNKDENKNGDTWVITECGCKRRTILILSRTRVKCQCLANVFSYQIDQIEDVFYSLPRVKKETIHVT